MNASSRCTSCGADLLSSEGSPPICVRCALTFALGEVDEEFPTTPRPNGEVFPLAPTERIGPYFLRKLLGEGGMGLVWEAEQQEPVRRRVALKRLKLGMDGSQILARFESERQALALMNHPNIAQAFDAGCSEDGHPYFAMELVEGPWITRYCDAERLDLRRRLELFTEVCRGIQHAHQKGVIHRDIKPSNILVQTEGGRPVPKVIDFGVAKAIGAQLTDRTLMTQIGQRVGTLEYMSPEQAGPGGFDVDTRTDVYSLGTLLYELLTGRLPFEAPKGDADELRRRIREDEPVRPSARVAALGAAAAEVARLRGTQPAALAKSLRGELDWIALKALAKDRPRRYGSPEELAADLQRYLKDEPISARPDTLTYRVGKLVRRNRVVVALATLALAATVAGVVGILVQARTARRQRDFALRQWSRSEAINELNDFVANEFPWSEETLDRAEHVLGHQQGLRLADRVEILVLLSTRSGLEKGSIRLRRTAEEAYRLSRGVSEPSIRADAACALGLALAVQAAMSDKSLLPRAAAFIREGLGELPEEPEFALDRASCLSRGSYVSRIQGATSESIARLQLAQQILKQTPSHSAMLDLNVSLALGDSLRLEGRHRDACAEYEHLSARLTALGREDSMLAGVTYFKWGTSLYLLGRPLEAEKLIHRAIVQFSRSEDDPEAIPWQLIGHARAVRDLGQLAQAASQAEHAQDIAQKNGEQSFVNQALLLRASTYRLRGDLARAQGMLDELEPRLHQSLPPGDIAFASLRSEQALLAQARGDASTGLDRIDQAMTIAEASVKAGQQGADLVPIFMTYRSDMERQLGRTDEAVADANRALAQFQEATQPGTSSSNLGRAYLALGHALQAQDKQEQARAAFRSAAEHLQNTVGPEHPDTLAAKQLAGAS